MPNLMTGIVSNYLQYVGDIATNAATRWKDAMDKASATPNQYKADDLVGDVAAFWKDVFTFDPYAPIGGIPLIAFAKIDLWDGNFPTAPIPTLYSAQAELTSLYQVNGTNTISRAIGSQPIVSLQREPTSVIVKVHDFPPGGPTPPNSNGLYVGLVIADQQVVAQVHVLVEGV